MWNSISHYSHFALDKSIPFQNYNYIFNHYRILPEVALKYSPPGSSGYLFTGSVLLILSKYAKTHTYMHIHTQCVYSMNDKYCILSEFISLYLLNSNFQKYQKLLHTNKHS
jgi:hypothetical protein